MRNYNGRNDATEKPAGDALIEDIVSSGGDAGEAQAMLERIRAEKSALDAVTGRVAERTLARFEYQQAVPANPVETSTARWTTFLTAAAAMAVIVSGGILIFSLNALRGEPATVPPTAGPMARDTAPSVPEDTARPAPAVRTGQDVTPQSLAEAVERTQEGGELQLQSGTFSGQFTIRKKMRLTSQDGPVVIGQS